MCCKHEFHQFQFLMCVIMNIMMPPKNLNQWYTFDFLKGSLGNKCLN